MSTTTRQTYPAYVPPPECLHPRWRLAVYTNGADVKLFGKQCQVCGKWIALKKADLTLHQRQDAIPHNDLLGTRYHEQRQRLFEQYRDAREAYFAKTKQDENAAWWAWYASYLATPEWQTKRRKVLERGSSGGEACLTARATQAHHLTYAHVGNEALFELVAICATCHERVHDKQKDGAL